jgi:hypothetical protein
METFSISPQSRKKLARKMSSTSHKNIHGKDVKRETVTQGCRTTIENGFGRLDCSIRRI